jgi:hypothetical protein
MDVIVLRRHIRRIRVLPVNFLHHGLDITTFRRCDKLLVLAVNGVTHQIRQRDAISAQSTRPFEPLRIKPFACRIGFLARVLLV